MAFPALGIHVGHDSSCALAVDGVIVSGLQQERATRRKHDGSGGLTNRLPISEVLIAGSASLDDLGAIVSCFQAAAPAGDGLGRAYVASDFAAFDPLDSRHVVVSHHQAHAFHTAAASGLDSCAVLVCDLGGSTTRDGEDYLIPYREWFDGLAQLRGNESVKTECLSIYRWDRGHLSLIDRAFVTPHSAPGTFVFSPASLYEIICAALFDGRPAYGELMAMASFGDPSSASIRVSDIVEIDGDDVTWLNGWQRSVQLNPKDFLACAAIANVVQQATELALVAYARRAMRLAGSNRLVAAGGMFLNINSNSRIMAEAGCEHFYIPSAPHDAGISHGCALIGSSINRPRAGSSFARYKDDRLGPFQRQHAIEEALSEFDGLIQVEVYDVDKVSDLLASGGLVARCVGRSEFGPRALGGRSLLASPCDGKAKDLLNIMKGRQLWRPVAPIALAETASIYFDGPTPSPFMNLLQLVREEWRDRLPALRHPDHSTRLQTLDRCVDPDLHELICSFGRRTGISVLVNTSLNGPGQPIVERPRDAIRFLLEHPELDLLILGTSVVRRLDAWADSRALLMPITLPAATIFVLARSVTGVEARLIGSDRTHAVRSTALMVYLTTMGSADRCADVICQLGGSASEAAIELYDLVCAGLLTFQYNGRE